MHKFNMLSAESIGMKHVYGNITKVKISVIWSFAEVWLN